MTSTSNLSTLSLLPTQEEYKIYSEPLKQFSNHVTSIINPHLFQDVKKALSQFTQDDDLINYTSGIGRFFHILPKDTKMYLGKLDKKIVLLFSKIDDIKERDNILKDLKEKINDILEKKRKEIETWPELDNLLAIDEIKKLENDQIKSLIELINEKNSNGLIKFTKEALKKIDINPIALNNERKKKKLPNLDTLLNQSVAKKPSYPTSLNFLWKLSESAFLYHQFSFKNNDNSKEVQGVIQKYSKDQNTVYLNLHDKTEISIAKNDHDQSCKVTCREFQAHPEEFVLDMKDAVKEIKIGSEVDEAVVKKYKRKEIENLIEEIRIELCEEKSKKRLSTLINSLVSNQLGTIKIETIRNEMPDLYKQLNLIRKKYAEDLKIEKTSGEILKDIVLQVNYILLVNKDDCLIVANTMRLLQEAHEHLLKIKDKEIILFIGNTGAGKSTCIAYLLNPDNIEEAEDEKKRRVYYKLSEDAQNAPNIGHSFIQSETVFAHGYELPDRDGLFLVDCAGFKDTRGKDYELCAHFSIDQLIKKARAVRAIVIIVPIAAFNNERATSIVEILENARSIFPNILTTTHEDHQRIHILVTHHNQLEGNLEELLSEGISKSCSLDKKEADSKVSNQNLQDSTQKVFDALKNMDNEDNRRIKCVQLTDSEARNDLLDKYTLLKGGLNINKYYNSLMKNSRVQLQFGQFLEMFAATWYTLLNSYTTELPEKIEKIMMSIKKHKAAIDQAIRDEQNRIKDIKKQKETLEKINEQVKEIEEAKGKKDPESLSTELKEKITKMADQAKEFRENINKKTLDRKETDLETANDQKAILLDKGEKLLQTTESAQKELSRLRRETYNISTGVTDVNLEHIEFNINETIAISNNKYHITEGIDQDNNSVDTIDTNNFVGTLKHKIVIEREYQLIPPQNSVFFKLTPRGVWYLNLRERFYNLFRSKNFFEHKTSFNNKNYSAQMSGKYVTFDIGTDADNDGRNVTYYLNTHWIGDTDKLPSFKIVHTIPNNEFNKATIVNNNAKIKNLEKEIKEYEDELQKIKNDKIANSKEITKLNQEILGLRAKVEALKIVAKINKISELLETEKINLAVIQYHIQSLESSTEYQDKKKIAEMKLENDEKELAKAIKKKRDHAIIIETEKKSAELLLEFSKMEFEEYSIIGRLPKLNEELHKFSKLYSSCKDKLMASCQTDLN